MAFLALSTPELEETLLTEVDSNPALEIVDEIHCPGCGRRLHALPCRHCAAPRDDGQAIVFLSPRDASRFSGRGDDVPEAAEPRSPERLDEYVLHQVGPLLDHADRPLAMYILARLNDDGLLPESAAEVAAFTHRPLADVERVLGLIRRADPPGIAAESAEQSLLIQIDCLTDGAPSGVTALAREIVLHYFPDLARLDFGHMARALGTERAQVAAAARFIRRNLTPYPARAFWGEGKLPAAESSAILRNPDATFTMANDRADCALMVEVFAPFAGWLRVNPEFKAALAECSESEREKWGPAVEQATLITKCVQQRNHTMRRLMEVIAAEQRAFILGGDGDLRPLTRARIAATLGVHESTISRAVAGKCAALPDGRMVPLSKFFDRSLSVRDRVRHLIRAEARPLTDDEIAAALHGQGLKVARRTVAKYRNMLGILPANARRRRARAHQLISLAA
jgi:RNA polymerase sigma-54 factor